MKILSNIQILPTYERLANLLDYCDVTGYLTWKALPSSRVRFSVGDRAGTGDSDGYLRFYLDGNVLKVHRVVWFLHHKKWPVGDTDHKDGNRTNNLIGNLRDISHQENMENRAKANSNNRLGSTAVPGVGYIPSKNVYQVRISKGGKSIHCKVYRTLEEANKAATEARGKNA